MLNVGSKEFHNFFLAQLQLLAAMCRGNNTEVIDALLSRKIGVEINFELIMCAITNKSLRASYPKTVAAFIELMKGNREVL